MRMVYGITIVVLLSLAGEAGAAALDPAPRQSGEILHLRLLTRLSSRQARPGVPFSAFVTRPLLLHDEAAVPVGTRLEGSVAAARQVGLGFQHERARIALDFHRLIFPDGAIVPLHASLAGVDNAREEVDAAGRIRGIRSTHSLGDRMNVRLGGFRLTTLPIAYRSLVASYPLEFLPLWFANAMIFGLTDPEIEFPAGSEFQIRLREPWPYAERFPVYRGERPERLRTDPALTALVESLPALSRFEKSGLEADPVNVVLVGSPAAAFRAAGWKGADERRRGSCFRAMRAIATEAPYGTGPMNTLLLQDRRPDGEWQKGLNTYNKRHHLRAWAAHELWDGDPLWLLAATHDIGLNVRGGALTHEIDQRIDREREKVVADLLLTGCVDAVTYVHRPIAGRRLWVTDGRVAVVRLNVCASPVRWDSDFEPDDGPAAPRSLVWRMLQRISLNARNTLLRENHAYRAYDLVRHLVMWRRLNRGTAGAADTN